MDENESDQESPATDLVAPETLLKETESADHATPSGIRSDTYRSARQLKESDYSSYIQEGEEERSWQLQTHEFDIGHLENHGIYCAGCYCGPPNEKQPVYKRSTWFCSWKGLHHPTTNL